MSDSTTVRIPWEAEWHFAEWVAERHRHDQSAETPPQRAEGSSER